MIDFVRKKNLHEMFMGDAERCSIEERCFNATVLTSGAITTAIALESKLLELPGPVIRCAALYSFLYATIYILNRSLRIHRLLIWPYLLTNCTVMVIDWLHLGGFTGMTLAVSIATTAILPIIMPARQLSIGIGSMGLILTLILFYTLTNSQAISQHEHTATQVVNLFTNMTTIAFGLALLTYFVMKTYRKQKQKLEMLNHQLEENNVFLDSLLNTIPVPIFYKDTQGVYRKVNNAFCDALGLDQPNIIGRKSAEIIPLVPPILSEETDNRVLRTGRMESYENKVRFRDNLLHQVLIRKNPHVDHRGEVIGIVGSMIDITERKIHEAKIQYLAHHDLLTGLFNRNYFYETLKKLVSKAVRHDQPLSLLLIDLDGFKQINDTLGHDAGDATLKEVGERLKGITRNYDIVCRLGGDEFAVLLDEKTDKAGIAAIAEKILSSLSRPIIYTGHECFVTGSIGIAIFPENTDSLDELVKEADNAMYQAKSKGKNQYHFSSSSPALAAGYINTNGR